MGSLIELTEPGGAKTTYTIISRNGFSLVSAVRDAMGGITKTEYDLVGRVVAQVDALGRRTVYELDLLGRVVKVTFPGGNFHISKYSKAGLVEETRDARGAVTRYEYDKNGRLTQTTHADDGISSQSYDAVGRVVERINAAGAVERTVYDAAGRVTASIDALGKVTRTEYNPTGTVKLVKNARDKKTTFSYDELDRLVETKNALGHVTRQKHAPDGEVVLTVNARGAEIQMAFDKNGRLVATTDPVGGTVKRVFDEAGDLVRVEDELKHAWTFKYDLLHRRIRETDPLGRTTHYRFNALELVSVRHADGSEWHYHRDGAGRVTARVILDKTGKIEDIERFEHDIAGNRIRAQNNAVMVTSEHDIMGREVKRTTLWKKTGATRELKFSFDKLGRRVMMVDSHGRGVGTEYDLLSRPVKMRVLEPNPRATGILDAFFERVYAFAWDNTSNLVEVKYPNGIRTRREHDDIDRLTKLVHERVSESGATEVLASWTIDRDKAGNPEKIVRETGETWTMEHDLADRLTRVALPRELLARLREKDPAKAKDRRERDDHDDDEDAAEKLMRVGVVEYRYDAAHNRKEEDYAGRVVRSEFNDANEMKSRGSMAFKYNERGDQVEKLHKSGRREVFSYSASGKLASYATGHVRSRHLKEAERYLYGPDADRVLVEDVQGKKLRHELFNGSRAIEEWHEAGHGSGRKEKGHFYTRDLGGQLLEQARFTRRGGKTAHASEDDDFDEWDDDEDRRDEDGWRHGPRKPKLNHVRWYHGNMLGTTSLITNYRGRVLDRFETGPWGEPLEGNFKKAVFGFTGHRWEQGTGHWSSLHRYLDPRAARWTSRDPIGERGGLHRYRYVENAPISTIDPDGLQSLFPIDLGKIVSEIVDRGRELAREAYRRIIGAPSPNSGQEVFARACKEAGICGDDRYLMNIISERQSAGTTPWLCDKVGTPFPTEINDGKKRCGKIDCVYVTFARYELFTYQYTYVFRHSLDPTGPDRLFRTSEADLLYSAGDIEGRMRAVHRGGATESKTELICTKPRVWYPCKVECRTDPFRPR